TKAEGVRPPTFAVTPQASGHSPRPRRSDLAGLQRFAPVAGARVLREDRVHLELAYCGVVVRVASVVDHDVELIPDCDVRGDGCVLVVPVCECLGLERGVASID